jgi:L-iditol 2-dehydrogenase
MMRRTNFDPGGFSEYVRLPRVNVERGVFPLPDRLSFEEATFVEPLACVSRSQRLAEVSTHHTLLILGSGISGLLHLKLAKAHGVRRIVAVDLNEYRLRAAKRFGADKIINAEEDVPRRLKEFNEDRLADRVIVSTGAKAASEQALRSIDRGGKILFFAAPRPGDHVSVPVGTFWLDEIELTASYGASPRDLTDSLQLLESGSLQVRDMITHRLPLAETGKGFALVADASESMKVIIEPQQ